jgi:hypothetical protein
VSGSTTATPLLSNPLCLPNLPHTSLWWKLMVLTLLCVLLSRVPAGWPVSLLEKLGLSDLLAKWPQEVLPLAAPVGHLTAR